MPVKVILAAWELGWGPCLGKDLVDAGFVVTRVESLGALRARLSSTLQSRPIAFWIRVLECLNWCQRCALKTRA